MECRRTVPPFRTLAEYCVPAFAGMTAECALVQRHLAHAAGAVRGGIENSAGPDPGSPSRQIPSNSAVER